MKLLFKISLFSIINVLLNLLLVSIIVWFSTLLPPTFAGVTLIGSSLQEEKLLTQIFFWMVFSGFLGIALFILESSKSFKNGHIYIGTAFVNLSYLYLARLPYISFWLLFTPMMIASMFLGAALYLNLRRE